MIEALEERDTRARGEARARDHTLSLANFVESHGKELFG